MRPFSPFNFIQPRQVSGAYTSTFYPTQTSGFDFSQIMQMFMPVMMMTMMLGMVGGMMRSTRREESLSQEKEPLAA